ncbi:MAG: oligosaccharide flippase family protein [Rhodobacteraceae bacterium]|nr:oligosaccharide flippase family protein [Paracoccaceae bacterium]
MAQGIATLALPVLTRLYDPEAFSVLAGFASVLAMFTAVSCLRFNVAIPLPEHQDEAAALLVLSLLSSTVIGLLSFGMLEWTFVGDFDVFRDRGLDAFSWLICAAVVLSGFYLAFQSWAARRKAFKRIAKTKVTRAGWSVVTQVGVGVVNPIPLGLLLGHTVLHGFGFLSLAFFAWRDDRADLMGVNKTRLGEAVRGYWRYPVFSTPEALLNAAGTNLPVLIIVASAAPAEAGFMFLAMKVMGLPMMLVGRSVTQVYVAEAGEKLRNGTLSRFTLNAMWSLAKLGAIPFLIIGATAPFLAEPALGEGWGRTGVLLAWMVPWFFLQFVTSPISVVLLITSNQVLALGLQAFGLLLRVGVVYLALDLRPDRVSEAFAISGAVFYVVYLALILVVLRVVQSKGQVVQ